MPPFYQIQNAILKVSCEAQVLIPTIPIVRSEEKLLSELVLCILSSQDKYEIALAAVKELRLKKILQKVITATNTVEIRHNIETILHYPIAFESTGKTYKRRLRFFVKKTNYIVLTLENIYLKGLTIRKILNQDSSAVEPRKKIMKHSYGLGPKQASMFLRNIGYNTDLAVLDKHVIDYMKLVGLISSSITTISSYSTYIKTEKKLQFYSKHLNLSLFHLDLAIWITMRNLRYSKI